MSEKTKILGKAGEDFAAKFLESKNYKIIARNYRIKSAEIDIIAELNDEIIFVEVKTRSNTRRGLPAEAVNLRKQKKIIEAASVFLQDDKFFDRPCRFDIIEIYSTGKNFELRHIENAFEVTSDF
ncbi:MAG: YraN family protein [Selenomonadaceae bacterium]|nr:YraN family protein [Selenomonadaceae bacterium]